MSEIVKQDKDAVVIKMSKVEAKIYCQIMVDNIGTAMNDENISDEVILMMISFVEPMIELATDAAKQNFNEINKSIEEESEELTDDEELSDDETDSEEDESEEDIFELGDDDLEEDEEINNHIKGTKE